MLVSVQLAMAVHDSEYSVLYPALIILSTCMVSSLAVNPHVGEYNDKAIEQLLVNSFSFLLQK